MRYRTSLIFLCASAALVGAVSAGDFDPFRDADPIHDIGLARLADEAGDAALKAALTADPSAEKARPAREKALVAVRAAPHAAAPELLVPGLVALAVGRDPDLAPEASHALLLIAERLRPSELAAREVLQADLQRALQAVSQGRSTTKGGRADVMRELADFEALLASLIGTKPG
jgi:hypothetical protein